MRSITSRLQRIEACFPRRPVRRPLSDADAQCWDAFESLLRNMDPDHANLLKRELRLWAGARHRGIRFEISSLLFAAFKIVASLGERDTACHAYGGGHDLYIEPRSGLLVRVRGLRIRASSPTSTASRARTDHLLCPMPSVWRSSELVRLLG